MTKDNDLSIRRIKLHRCPGNGHFLEPGQRLGDDSRMQQLARFALLCRRLARRTAQLVVARCLSRFDSYTRRAGMMIQLPLPMAPDLIFDEIRGAIKARIGLVRLRVRLDCRAEFKCNVQSDRKPEPSRSIVTWPAAEPARYFCKMESMRTVMCSRSASPMSKFLPETRKVIAHSPLPAPAAIPGGATHPYATYVRQRPHTSQKRYGSGKLTWVRPAFLQPRMSMGAWSKWGV